MNDPTESQSAKLAAVLDRAVPPEMIAQILSEALVSTIVDRSGVILPDTRMRVAAAKLLMEYQIGKPLERQHVVTQVLNDPEQDLDARLAKSPALRRNLRKRIEAAEGIDV